MQNFDTILKLILEHEGGKCNKPTDAGGKTNRGVTQKTYDKQRTEIMGQKGVKPEDIPKQKDVYDLTDKEIYDFYKFQFHRYCADLIQNPDTCYVFFDAVINIGSGNANKSLQYACKLIEDGIFGDQTYENANSLNQRELQQKMLNYREEHYKKQGSYKYNKDGWNNRLKKIQQQVEQGIMKILQQNNNNQVQQQQHIVVQPIQQQKVVDQQPQQQNIVNQTLQYYKAVNQLEQNNIKQDSLDEKKYMKRTK